MNVRLDEHKVTLSVDVDREGALSAVGHDVRLVARKLTLAIDGDSAALDVDASALAFVGVRRGDVVDGRGLSPSDAKKIETSTRDDVLRARRFPRVTARATVEHGALSVSLTLAGVTRAIAGTLERSDARATAVVRVRQSDFGIAPFSALLGTLRVKDVVTVRVEVDLS